MALQVVAQPQHAAQQWFSAPDYELANTDDELFDSLSELAQDIQLQVHPDRDPRPGFALSAVREVNPGGLFVHIGGYRPAREDRIWLRLLREHVGNVAVQAHMNTRTKPLKSGPRSKPLGQLNGYAPVQVTEAQLAVLVRALELMEHRAALLAALEGGDINNVLALQQQQPQQQQQDMQLFVPADLFMPPFLDAILDLQEDDEDVEGEEEEDDMEEGGGGGGVGLCDGGLRMP
ncbi:hypothetical protein TSOC_010764 [Tetrabaena socialis]|uniref:Uncharacterized protein n=1 Tax=Tetrabaena socialis TaxID=47790 RepID=A0A2J7ZSE6_9CHLO|nr:hypothetical protein TSOC_010765 [Tetrabaena socialis]PNH03186.1 hypothetical protein TSOC_010764 [Tetrabaena socialis]|eukprot:PNH03185.1 hypothetical protein TSOC_010765 [Tetrabaena socialis]